MKKSLLVAVSVIVLCATAPASAMHISDGVLSVKTSVLWYALTVPVLILGVYSIKRRRKETSLFMTLVAMVGAAVFILSVFHIPVPVAGSCSHPTGGAIAAITVGVLPAVVINFIALLFQALFLAHGGLLSLGANTFSMGIVGVSSGYAVFRLAQKIRIPLFIATGLGGLVADLMTYFTAGLQLAIDLHGSKSILDVYGVYMLGYLPTQIPLSILDFILAGFMAKYIAQKRPAFAQQIQLVQGKK